MSNRKFNNHRNQPSNRWLLIAYDLGVFAVINWLMIVHYISEDIRSVPIMLEHTVLSLLCIFIVRNLSKVYKQIWRYGGIQCYIRLFVSDSISFLIYTALNYILPIHAIAFIRIMGICALNLLAGLGMRMMYRYCYKCGDQPGWMGAILRSLLHVFSAGKVDIERFNENNRIRIAIIGAGKVGVSLAEELLANPGSGYIPTCFIDVNTSKVGRDIHDIPVISEDTASLSLLKDYEVQEIVFAIPTMSMEKRKELYNYYRNAGYKIKVYDYPTMQGAGNKRNLREFDIEELLFRKPVNMINERTRSYYRGKVVLITGGGGSIGSELCRQIARMKPEKLIILDVYENCAYEIQQELKSLYKNLNLYVEIISITNKKALQRVFENYHPQIVIHAAAHKHVPLMEHNCIEAVENNVFGTYNVVTCCEEYGAERFMMVSTDKAVNPTNIMGATKRMCEMIVQAHSTVGKVKYSVTRFGNVLGSAGSVIPLFKRQIAAGGPVTLTDKRIIRYFMTIPEASQLVLTSGALANNGELFVLDMGQPVKILDLAENMIRLAGVQGIEIVETGLRPGEKLYEELLVKSDELEKTENELIFIEREEPITMTEMNQKLEQLKLACAVDDEEVRRVMKQVVPTYKDPKEVNKYVG